MASSTVTKTTPRPALLAQIGAVARGEARPHRPPAEGQGELEVSWVRLERLRDNPYQHRSAADEAEMEELVQGIKAQGLIQPVTARKAGADFQIIDGWRRATAYRRLLASAKAPEQKRWQSIPVVVREASDEEMAVLALQANLQREDPNPVDVASGVARLSRDFGRTYEQIATGLGMEVKKVQRLMRLFEAPDFIKVAVAQGQGGRRLPHIAALEALKLYNHLHKAEDEARAQERTQVLIHQTLKEDWGLRRLEAEVERLLQGSPKKAKAGRGGAGCFKRTKSGFSLNLARATRASSKERQEAIAQLKELIKLLSEVKE